MEQTNKLPSRFQIDDEVMYEGLIAIITGVQFTKSQVSYNILSPSGGYCKWVDSLEISPVEKQ